MPLLSMRSECVWYVPRLCGFDQIIRNWMKQKFDVVEYLVLDEVNRVILNARQIIGWK